MIYVLNHKTRDCTTMAAKCGRNLSNSATYDPAAEVMGIDWHKEFSNPFPEDSKKLDGEFILP
jgi:hypothetical protein